MKRVARTLLYLAAFAALQIGSNAALAEKIGVASAVVNQVQGISGGSTRTLAVGNDVFANERIRTSDSGTAQLIFLDKTSLSIGPRAELALDRFVFNPRRGAGQVVLSAAQGAFRFITGSQNPNNYTIKTPVATLGIRGTILDFLLSGNPTTGYTLTVILVECCALITLPSGQQLNLTTPGTAFVINSNGTVEGPVQWSGSIVNAPSGVSFPLYGWYFQGEPSPNGFPTSQVGTIDQLNAVIAQQLSNLATHNGGGGGGGECQGEECRHRRR